MRVKSPQNAKFTLFTNAKYQVQLVKTQCDWHYSHANGALLTQPMLGSAVTDQTFYRPSVIHTKDKILNAAEQLITLKGVYGFNLHDIAEKVGIKVPSIYKHFKNKDEVLMGVSKRFVELLSLQFQLEDGLPFTVQLRQCLDTFVDFHIQHPAFVRLAIIDFATPKGGMEYVTAASGGNFEENITSGVLSVMHSRVKTLLDTAESNTSPYRKVDNIAFYRLIYSSLLIQRLFPSDTSLVEGFSRTQHDSVKDDIYDLAIRYLKK